MIGKLGSAQECARCAQVNPLKRMSSVQWPTSVTEDSSKRMRWIAEYLDLAERAISVIACVQSLDYPADLQGSAQRDLRRWAHWLDLRPTIAADLAVARVVPGPGDIVTPAMHGSQNQVRPRPRADVTYEERLANRRALAGPTEQNLRSISDITTTVSRTPNDQAVSRPPTQALHTPKSTNS